MTKRAQKTSQKPRPKRAHQRVKNPNKQKNKTAVAAMKVVRRKLQATGNPALATAIGRALSLPADFPPLRMPEMGNVRHSCALKFNATEQALAVNGYPGVTANTAQRWMVMQNPVVPVWCDQVAFRGIDTAICARDQLTWPSAATGQAIPHLDVTQNFAHFTNIINGASIDENIPVIGVAGARQWAYAPNGTAVDVGIRVSSAVTGSYSGAIDVLVESYNGNDYSTSVVSVGTSAASRFTGWLGLGAMSQFNGPCWYRIASVTSTNASYSVTAAGTAYFELILSVRPATVLYDVAYLGTSWTGMLPWAPGVYVNGLASNVPYESSRCTAVSLLLTNVTAELSKEGSILAARLNPNTKNPWTFNASTLAGVADSDKANLGLKNGLYTFLAPQILPMRDYTVSVLDLSYKRNPVVYLEDLPYCNVAILSDQNAATVSAMNVTLSFHVEFMSSLQLFPVGYSHVDPMAFHQALLVLARTGFFFENPSHWAALSSRIKALMSKSWPYLKPALVSGARAAGTTLLSSLL